MRCLVNSLEIIRPAERRHLDGTDCVSNLKHSISLKALAFIAVKMTAFRQSKTGDLFPDSHFLAVLIDGDVGDFGFRDAYRLTVRADALGFDGDFDRNRSAADTNRFGVKTHQITDKNRLKKNNFLHCHGDETVVSGSFDSFDSARHVNVAQNNSAENRAVRVRVARHHRNADSNVAGDLGFGIWDLGLIFHI